MLKLSALILALFASWRFDSYLYFRRLTPSFPPCKCTNCTAVALREQSAALAPFQRQQPSNPPDKIVNSAVSPVLPASHFSGYIAQFATNET